MRLLPLLCLSLLLTTCVRIRLDPPIPYSVASSCREVSADLNVVTFNAAIAPGMNGWSTPRLPHVVEALGKLEYDVLCVQEVWPYDDARAVAGALGLPKANIAYADTRGLHETGKDVCSPDAVSDLVECVAEHCVGVPDEDVSLCALDNCSGDLMSLYLFDRPCFNCAAASVGRSIEETVATCTRPGGASRLYGGTNGIMLASRWPLEKVEAVDLPSSNANRVALIARVRPPGQGPVEIACTHMTSPQRISPTYPGFSDWPSEQRRQVQIISERLASRSGGRPQVFTGDLNVSRMYLEGGTGQSADVYWTAVELGFRSPAAYARPDLCSACRDNSFRGVSSKSHLIDHVMYRDPEGGTEVMPVCAERLFTETVDVTAYGETRRMHISDHFGIRVKFDLK